MNDGSRSRAGGARKKPRTGGTRNKPRGGSAPDKSRTGSAPDKSRTGSTPGTSRTGAAQNKSRTGDPRNNSRTVDSRDKSGTRDPQDKQPWFGSRASGLGYRPRTWQGYVVMLLLGAYAIFIGTLSADRHSPLILLAIAPAAIVPRLIALIQQR